MNLRQKSVLISMGTTLLLVTTIAGASYRVVMNQFQVLENQRVERNIRRFSAIFDDRLNQINAKLADWTIWDDTYRFISDKNDSYIRSNLTQESFASSEVDEALFINNQGGLVASFLLEKPGVDEEDFPQDVYQHFATDSALLNISSETKNNQGFVKTEDGLLLFVVRQVVKSDGTGTPNGYVVFARYFDDNLLASLKDLTQFDAEMLLWDSPLPPDYQQAKDNYEAGNKTLVKTQDAKTISGFLIVEDPNKNPLAIVKGTLASDIVVQGRSSIGLFMWLLVASGALSVLANYLLLTQVVLKKIFSITDEVDLLGRSGVAGSRLKINKNESDEIDKLRSEINLTLDAREQEKQNSERLTQENIRILEGEKESQEKIRTAMINLLEDGKVLEEELKVEKAGVEQKIVERTRELTETKARLDSSIENLPLGFIMTDIQENMVITNSMAENILGEKDGKARLIKLKGTLKEKIDLGKYIKNCGEEKRHLMFSDIAINNRYYQFLLSPILTKEDVNVCLGVVILIQDITDAKLLERSRDEFFSIASHELRTPLTAIRGNTAMILEYYAETVKDPELKSMIDDVHDSSVRLIKIVNDFLNISRLEQNRMVFETQKLDIIPVIQETIKEYLEAGIKKNIVIKLTPPATPPKPIAADADKVRQVLANMLGNSLKYTAKGKIDISVEPTAGFLKVVIQDTGRGIPQKQQDLLFHKFSQAGSNIYTRDTAGGSGLGLYISRMLIEGMGGELKLEKSEEGKGSTFSFTLPIANKNDKVDNSKAKL
jgi:signal transduction histidine kinase/sensor domain CHASE-containing protein